MAHQQFKMHPMLSHFFRFWLWITDGTGVREWVAIHHSHHRYSDKPGDPHKGFIEGSLLDKIIFTWKIFFKSVTTGYSGFATKQEMERYASHTPQDWIERKLYNPHQRLGIFLLLGLNLFLFGWHGVLAWVIQVCWVTLWMTVIVTVGAHHVGYRNKDIPDNSRNLFPIGIIIAGEEMHHNHHMEPGNPKLRKQWFELDIGYSYLKLLSFLGLIDFKR
jgi:fatty-acid desaturase